MSKTIDYQEIEKENGKLESHKANKRSVLESMDFKTFINKVTFPFVIAACSTKHENGRRNRALFASNDEHYLISSFASDYVEQRMDFEHIHTKQSDRDKAEWINRVVEKNNNIKVSLDYADFNIQHDLLELATLNICLGCEYSKIGGRLAIEKVISTLWVACSCMVQFVKLNDTIKLKSKLTEDYRVHKGLFTGSRNTARDNSMMHRVYLDITASNVQSICKVYICDILQEYLSGDDEVTQFREWILSVLYCRVSYAIGFELNISKQIIAFKRQEYLRVILDEEKEGLKINRSIAQMLMNLCGGNWNTVQTLDFGSEASSVNSHINDLIRRGLNKQIGMELLKEIMEFRYNIIKNGQINMFEYKFLFSKQRIGFETIVDNEDIKDVQIKLEKPKLGKTPSKMSKDYISKNWQTNKMLDAKLRNELIKTMSQDSHIGILTKQYNEK